VRVSLSFSAEWFYESIRQPGQWFQTGSEGEYQRTVMAAVLSITLARLPSRKALRWKSAPFPRASTAASSSVTASASPASSSASLTCSSSALATVEAGSGRPVGPPGG
jgi:hypothetical protein